MRSRFWPFLSSIPLVLVLVAATSKGGPPGYCNITHLSGDYTGACQHLSVVEAYGGTECKPMLIIHGFVQRLATIPEGCCGARIPVSGHHILTSEYRIGSVGKLPPNLKDDCVPWIAHVRGEVTGANGGTGGAFAQITLGGETQRREGEGSQWAIDEELTGCLPISELKGKGVIKRAGFTTTLGAKVSVEVCNTDPVGFFRESRVIADPYVYIDPTWENADLFVIEQRVAPGVDEWSEVSNEWMNAVPWTDVTASAIADSGNSLGSGWCDYDLDGDLDLFYVNCGTSDRLLRNEGGGAFVDATPPALADSDCGRDATWVDYDNDGDPDLYVSRWYVSNRLLRNDGGGAFLDVTTPPLDDALNARSAVWADYDNDGDLDLYLANSGFGEANRLIRNDASEGFVDVASGALAGADQSQGAAWADYDNDGDPDLYVANYQGPNKLFRNDGGSLVDVSEPPVDDPGDSFGLAWGDYDNDGSLDLVVMNEQGDNVLLHNEGNGTFADSTRAENNDAGYTRGASWGDVDNDGDLDLYMTAGGLSRLLFNETGGRFESAIFHTLGPIQSNGVDFGVGMADYDGDGDLDVFLTANGPNRLLRNDSTPGLSWLQVRLHGTTSNSMGIGARVRVVSNGNSQIREVQTTSGLFNGDPPVAMFGLDGGIVDTLTVQWPSGATTVHSIPFGGGRIIDVDETAGVMTAAAFEPPGPGVRLYRNHPNPFNPATVIRYEVLSPGKVALSVYDLAGRHVRTLVRRAHQTTGAHRAEWDGRDGSGTPVSSGVYVYRLVAADGVRTGKMALLR